MCNTRYNSMCQTQTIIYRIYEIWNKVYVAVAVLFMPTLKAIKGAKVVLNDFFFFFLDLVLRLLLLWLGKRLFYYTLVFNTVSKTEEWDSLFMTIHTDKFTRILSLTFSVKVTKKKKKKIAIPYKMKLTMTQNLATKNTASNNTQTFCVELLFTVALVFFIAL